MSDNFVVVSKLKKLIKSKSGMNTSSSAVDPLNRLIMEQVEKAIENAKNDRRKTVMDRDFPNF